MTERESRRKSDEEIIDEAVKAEWQFSVEPYIDSVEEPALFIKPFGRDVALRAVPKLKKQAQIDFIYQVFSETRKLRNMRLSSIGTTLDFLDDWLELKRKEV